MDNRKKLAAAKKLWKQRREAKWHKENRDDLTRSLDSNYHRKSRRKKLGIPLDTPKLKPHEGVKLAESIAAKPE